MTATASEDRSGLFSGFAARAFGVAALVAATGWLLAPRWFAGEAGLAAVVGCAAALVASLVGGLVLIAKPPDPQTAAVRALAAMGLRLVVVAALVVIAGFGLELPMRPLLLWTALSYVALLAVDTKFALTASGAQMGAPPKTGEAASDTKEATEIDGSG